MSNQRLNVLYVKFLTNSINEIELKEFLHLLDTCDEDLFDRMIEENHHMSNQLNEMEIKFQKGQVLSRILNRIEIQDEEKKSIWNVKTFKWLGLVAALLLMTLSFLYVKINNSNLEPIVGQNVLQDIRLKEESSPTILRSDGRAFQITDKVKDSIEEEGLIIAKDNKGNRIYKLSKAKTALSETRTFISPKGSSLQLELEDGTRMWLNSGASITYPAVFAKNQREIAITGEVFLDVFPNKNRPFIIKAKQTRIKVLGTEFNVYSDNSVNNVATTLIEGSVEVSIDGQSKILKPGFTSISSDADGGIAIQKANIKSILAWKDGYFRFDNDKIETVISKIREWYDIDEVTYLRHSEDEFSGMIKRTKSLNELLQQMEKISNYKFMIKDGRVLVM